LVVVFVVGLVVVVRIFVVVFVVVIVVAVVVIVVVVFVIVVVIVVVVVVVVALHVRPDWPSPSGLYPSGHSGRQLPSSKYVVRLHEEQVSLTQALSSQFQQVIFSQTVSEKAVAGLVNSSLFPQAVTMRQTLSDVAVGRFS